MSLRERLQQPDTLAILALIGLWLLFFWRLFTPVPGDMASFRQGDFSGQFVTFGAYQYERMAAGAVPLWNPYNNGGFPFIADTQAAVFYPPRLLTMLLSQVAGGWSYNALQLEAAAHVLFYSLMMYLFLRRLTLSQAGSVYGAFIAAIVAAYGGFVSGYPMLQLALLESAIWLPLTLTGILEATRTRQLHLPGLSLAGFALGLSWLAGHPQTAWFLTMLVIAWLAYRTYQQQYRLWSFVRNLGLVGIITLGVCAVTLLPGVEYLRLTARPEMGFDARGNGFPFQDVMQFVYPGSVSLFSPLYVGIPALILAGLALHRHVPTALFWAGVLIVALIHSFGAQTAWYHATYNLLPGLRFFRGQERAAFLVANSLAILAGMGMVALAAWQAHSTRPIYRRVLPGLLAVITAVTLLIVMGWFGNPDSRFGDIVGIAVFSTLILAVAVGLIVQHMTQPHRLLLIALCALIVFELFSVNMNAESNYESIPATQQLSLSPPAHIQTVLDDMNTSEQPFRVDGFRGLRDNYGSLYGVMDIRGISPLFLRGAQRIIYRDYVNNPLAWELFAVQYIYSERESFGQVVTDVIMQGDDQDGGFYLHRLDDPRPFALLLYDTAIVDSDDFALALLDDPRFNARETVILHEDPGISLPDSPPENSQARITEFAPESISIDINTPENAILSLSQVDYPGWYASLNGEPVTRLRAYGALTAFAIPAGEHSLRLVYDPPLYRIGSILSLVTLAGLFIVNLAVFIRRRTQESGQSV